MAGFTRLPRKSSAERLGPLLLAGLGALTPAIGEAAGAAETGLVPYQTVGDAVPQSLTGRPGDPARGRGIVLSRHTGLCLLCHSGPFPEERLQGTLAPSLAGAGSRNSIGQLRMRIIDAGKLNASTIMPPYYKTEGITRVAGAYAGKPILTAEQIEDVVAFLATLKE